MTYDIILGRSPKERIIYGDAGTILLAKQYIRMGQVTALANKIFLDLNQCHAVFVVGKRGSGKSYSLGVMAEGMSQLPSKIGKNISCILLDTMGVYWTMKYPNHKDEMLLKEWGMESSEVNVQIYTPIGFFYKYREEGIPTDFPFSILPKELSASDWGLSFGLELHEPQGVVLEKIITDLQESGKNYSVADIAAEIKSLDEDKHIINSLVNRFESTSSWGVFSTEATPMKDLARGSQVTVLDLSPYATVENGWAIKTLVVGLVSQKLFTERMKARKKEELTDIENATQYFSTEEKKDLEQPLIWLILDEAHEFLPNNEKTTATDALITILREGRQPGISLVLATQQPGKIHTDVMTQSDIIIAHRVTAKIDVMALEMVAQSYLTEGIIKALNTLPSDSGAAIILDDKNERLFPCRMRPRISWHGGSAPHLIQPIKKDDF